MGWIRLSRSAGMVAVIALVGLVAATSASAVVPKMPQIGRCLAHAGGAFKEGACKTASKVGEEKFEWYPAVGKAKNGEEKPLVKKGYKSKAVATETAKIQLEGTGEKLGVKTVVACKEEESHGQILNTTEITGEGIVFKGCESAKVACSTTGAAAGEIKVNDLTGVVRLEKVGYNKEKKVEVPASSKAANEYRPKTGETFVEFNCAESLHVIVKGAILNPIKTNAMVSSATVKFTGTGGNQKPEHYTKEINLETGKETFSEEISLLAAFQKPLTEPEFEESGQTLTTTQTNEEKLEANTVVT